MDFTQHPTHETSSLCTKILVGVRRCPRKPQTAVVERDYRLKFFLVSWEDTKTWFVPGGGREGSPPPSQASRERLTAVPRGRGLHGRDSRPNRRRSGRQGPRTREGGGGPDTGEDTHNPGLGCPVTPGTVQVRGEVLRDLPNRASCPRTVDVLRPRHRRLRKVKRHANLRKPYFTTF